MLSPVVSPTPLPVVSTPLRSDLQRPSRLSETMPSPVVSTTLLPVVSTPLISEAMPSPVVSTPLEQQLTGVLWVIRIYCLVRSGADLHIEVSCAVCPWHSKTKGYNKVGIWISGFEKQQMFSRAWRKGVKKRKEAEKKEKRKQERAEKKQQRDELLKKAEEKARKAEEKKKMWRGKIQKTNFTNTEMQQH